MGKSKDISQDLMSGSSLGAISKCLKVADSSVQTIVRKYKHHGTAQLSYRSGRRHSLSPRDECTLVRKCKLIPEQQQRPCEDVGGNRHKSIYSISTVNRVLYRHNPKGRSARKMPLLQNRLKKARIRFATAHGDKYRTFWRNVP